MVEQTNPIARRRHPAGGRPFATAATRRTPLEAYLVGQMRAHASVPGRTKRSAARLALVAAIRDGRLEPGDMLPSEKALTTILDVSLGTVQAALRQLQQAGTIIRRRGDGSRVASVEPLADTIWHFRFIAKSTGQPMRMRRQTVAVDSIRNSGPWADYLGCGDEFVRIRRRITMNADVAIYAEMYLDTALASGLAAIDPAELEMVNIRPFLEERYGLFAAGARHTIMTTSLGRKTAEEMGLAPGPHYFEIHAKTFTAERSPIYFQRILARCADCVLDF